MIQWHPTMVHFPLALTVTSAVALSGAALVREERWCAPLAILGSLNLCLGALGAIAALGTGLAAVIGLTLDAAARGAVALHVKWAMFSSAALLLLAVWRLAGAALNARPSRLFLVLVWLVTAALIVTGYRGGQNVYRYGIGVERPPAPAPTLRSAP
jgi:uncharacterized membrane protein